MGSTSNIVQPAVAGPRRVFTPANLVSVAVGLGVFAAIVRLRDTNRGLVAAGLVGAAATGLVWWLWWHFKPTSDLHRTLPEPHLGTIPNLRSVPAPTLTDPDGEAATAFHQAVDALEASTTGQVVLVASPSPGQGTTTVAMNLAISATQAGRRVVLIDGDLTTRGLSRFMHTGPTPGLAELAAGEANLGEASRMWNLEGTSRLPVVPAGAPGRSEATLRSGAVADAVDVLTERADLVIIDSPPILWNGTSRPLAAHADGTVMVVSANADHHAVMKARTVLEDVGAPLLGYVVNRSGASKRTRQPWVRAIKRAMATFLVVMVVAIGWNAIQLWRSWQSVEREGFEPAAAANLLPLPPGGILAPSQLTPELTTAVTSPPADDAQAQAFLIIGSDLTYGNADVIILAMIPGDGSAPVMTSLPRDLYLPNRCTQGYTRINSNLSGCGSDINGPTLLALAVEDFTGIPVDHFALFDFEGFERIIDAVGGVEICVDFAVTDVKSFLDLPAGCSTADGAQALAWVRSRSTQEYVDGRWRTMAGVNDLTRNERQQDVLIQMFAKMREFGSPGELTKKIRSLTDAFTLDDGLRLKAAIDLAWNLRNSNIDEFVRVTIPVVDFLTDDGAQVLLPTQSFDQVLAAALPQAPPGSDPTVVR